jgi:glutathione peroxidase
MKKIVIISILMFSFFSKSTANYNQLAYDHSFKDIEGNLIELKSFKNKLIVVVNVASRCGFTYQYEGLEDLYTKYKENLVVIGVPSNSFKQEPGDNKEIKNFCESTFGITFPITEKNIVIGNNAHSFYKWARENYGISAIPKWNFHKIIIGKNGKIIETFSSIVKPTSSKFINYIEENIRN